MFILIFISLASSIYLTRLQRQRDAESHKKDPAARVASPVGDDGSVEDQPQQPGKGQKADLFDRDGLFEVSFHDIHCVIPGTNRAIVPGASGVIPAGKISALMGPTARYVRSPPHTAHSPSPSLSLTLPIWIVCDTVASRR